MMSQSKMIKKLTDAGITASSDGGLRDFVSRGNYLAAVGTIDASIAKRKTEIEFLEGFNKDLHQEILKDGEV